MATLETVDIILLCIPLVCESGSWISIVKWREYHLRLKKMTFSPTLCGIEYATLFVNTIMIMPCSDNQFDAYKTTDSHSSKFLIDVHRKSHSHSFRKRGEVCTCRIVQLRYSYVQNVHTNEATLQLQVFFF